MLEALERAEYLRPTPIQEKAIPPGLAGKDVIGCAATGTGKTAAFLLPIIERLAGKHGTRALVLAPTRELALQICDHLRMFGAGRRVRGAAIIGGASMNNQMRELREQREVIVATPGRLVDHIQQRTVRLDQIEVLVLDEADRMLDMGFKPQLDRILAKLPRARQTYLFSATMAGEVAQFAKRCLHDPVKVEVSKSGTVAKGATQCVYMVKQDDKVPALLSLLARDEETTLVFARTQHRADKVAKILSRAGIKTARIHGGRSQSQRLHALSGFKSGEYRVMVATDIAARGIDVSGIGHVINFDLSHVPEDHVHRVGRTARHEAVGHASSLCAPEENPLLRDIEKFTRGSIPRGEPIADLAHWRAEIARTSAAAQHPGHSRPHSRPHSRSGHRSHSGHHSQSRSPSHPDAPRQRSGFGGEFGGGRRPGDFAPRRRGKSQGGRRWHGR